MRGDAKRQLLVPRSPRDMAIRVLIGNVVNLDYALVALRCQADARPGFRAPGRPAHGAPRGLDPRCVVPPPRDALVAAGFVEIARGQVRGDRALRFTSEIAEALEAAHAVGLVHGVLRPECVLISDTGRVKLLDFGVRHLRTLPGDACPPEQAAGAPPDVRSDVWLLGFTVSAMFDHSVPDDLAHIVSRAMANDPAARYQDGAAIGEDIADLLAKNPGEAEKYRSGKKNLLGFGQKSTNQSAVATLASPLPQEEVIRPIQDGGRGGEKHP